MAVLPWGEGESSAVLGAMPATQLLPLNLVAADVLWLNSAFRTPHSAFEKCASSRRLLVRGATAIQSPRKF